MTKQFRFKGPSSFHHRLFEVSSLGSGIALLIVIIFLLGLLLRSEPGPEANGVIIGTELDPNGHIINDIRPLPVDTKKIYLQFYLKTRASAKTSLEFRWYVGEQLATPSSSGVYEEGYVITYFEPDWSNSNSFPAGNYHAEVWSGDTMILYKPFAVH